MKEWRIIRNLVSAGLVIGFVFNVGYAIGGYGVKECFLRNLLAQTSSADSTSSSTVNSTDPKFWENSCRNSGGYWNFILGALNGGVETVECSTNGEVCLSLGITIKGNYVKGQKYPLIWTLYGCVKGDGNCCYKNEQGISIGVRN